MIVSLISNTDVPHRNHNRLITNTTAEKKFAPKRQQINESGDRSELTALTTGSGSQSEQHDPENGDKSKQNHDHQTKPVQQTH